MGRAPCCDKANVKKGPWSPEEDAKLKSYIESYGTGGNWIALPQKIGLRRCGKSCRLRWLNYLRPNIRHGGFSEEEDNIICSLYISIGSRWSIIASQLPGRTDNDIKNYWNTRLKKKFLGDNCAKRNDSDYMSTMKQEVKKDAMATRLVTSDNPNIQDNYDQKPNWAMEIPYNLPNQYSSFKDFIFKLDGRFFYEEEKQGIMVDSNSFTFQHSSSSSSIDYTTPQVLLQPQFGSNHQVTQMQTQSEIKCSEEFLFSDTMPCGESNLSSWGYFTSLMTLPPSCSSDGYNLTMNPEVLH